VVLAVRKKNEASPDDRRRKRCVADSGGAFFFTGKGPAAKERRDKRQKVVKKAGVAGREDHTPCLRRNCLREERPHRRGEKKGLGLNSCGRRLATPGFGAGERGAKAPG